MEHLLFCEGDTDLKDAVVLEHRLWRLQNGELDLGAQLIEGCRERPDAPESPLILEACAEATLKVITENIGARGGSLHLADAPPIKRAKWAIDRWLESRLAEADQVQGLVWRGRLAAGVGDHAPGVADLREALRRDPGHFQARWYLAQQIASQHPDEAISHLERLARDRPEADTVTFVLAKAHRNMGHTDVARRMLDELLEARPETGDFMLERGLVEIDARRPAEAEQWLRKVEAMAPDNEDLVLALGRCLHLAGRESEARNYEARFEKLHEIQEQRRMQVELSLGAGLSGSK
jgi:predicted Zn-dependent protease